MWSEKCSYPTYYHQWILKVSLYVSQACYLCFLACFPQEYHGLNPNCGIYISGKCNIYVWNIVVWFFASTFVTNIDFFSQFKNEQKIICYLNKLDMEIIDMKEIRTPTILFMSLLFWVPFEMVCLDLKCVYWVIKHLCTNRAECVG